MPMEIIPSRPKGITDWPTDTEAIVAALRGCQLGLGGMFPNGTAGMYVAHEDHIGYAARREHLDRLADALEAGRITLTQETE